MSIENIKRKIKLWNEYHNPFYYWWKARKYFKRPKIHFIFDKDLWFFGMPARRDYYNPIIDINTSSLGWKWKYDEVRHEWDPYFQIVLFRKWHLLWVINWVDKKDKDSVTRSMATWEALLDYLYNNKTIEECISNHRWIANWGDDNEYEITVEKNVKGEIK